MHADAALCAHNIHGQTSAVLHSFSNNMYVRVTTSRLPVAKTFSFAGVVVFTAEVEVEVTLTVGVEDGHRVCRETTPRSIQLTTPFDGL